MEESKTLTERTADEIIAYILQEELKEGDRLPSEPELMKLLDVSRTTIREAVKMLSSRNILEVRHGSGIFVSQNTGISDDPLGFLFIKDKKKLVSDLIEFRMLVEPRIAARAAMNATPKQAEELSFLADEVERLYDQGLSHIAADTRFHEKLGELSGSLLFPNLAPIIFRGINMFIELTHSKLKEETIQSHRAIVNAVKKKDPVAAEDAMMLHLIYNRNRLSQEDE
ncbi:MAG: FadR/GntR family transcriptional regulator [bacterium]|nr:FadR/GntR family transcriptional regulator [bacterium]